MRKKKVRKLTQKRLKSLVFYKGSTGVFVSKKSRKVLGAKDAEGYLIVQLGVKFYSLHRLAWLYVYGKLPDGVIDHIDHDKGNNAIENLRDISQVENCKNQKLAVNNTSGVTGVFWNSTQEKWTAGIRVNRKYITLGNFESKEEAIAKRQEANEEYGFHENHGKPLTYS